MTNLVNAEAATSWRATWCGSSAWKEASFVAPGTTRTEAERDALFALAVLDAQMGPDGETLGDPRAAAAAFGQVRLDAEPGSGLWWSALRGAVQAFGLAGDRDGAADLVTRVNLEHPAVDTAGWATTNLVNLGRYATARAVAGRAGLGALPFAQPGGTAALSGEEAALLFSLAVLDAETGPDGQPVGDPGLARARFGRLRRELPAGSGLWWAALRGEAQTMGQLQDDDGLLALIETVGRAQPGAASARWAIPNLVRLGRPDAALALWQESGLVDDPALAPEGTGAVSEEDRILLLSLAALDVRTDAAQRPLGDPARARGRFRRVRLLAVPGSGNWWVALRGEAQAMGLLGDQAGIAALADAVSAEHPEVDSARWALPSLVNSGHYASARLLAAKSGLKVAAFTQPGSSRSLSPEDRDLVFFLAVLDAEIGPNNRPVGEPAMARGRFARVRRASAEGSDLWWAALRGEMQALDLLDARDEAAALTRDVEAGYPHLVLPPDILSRIGKAEAWRGPPSSAGCWTRTGRCAGCCCR